MERIGYLGLHCSASLHSAGLRISYVYIITHTIIIIIRSETNGKDTKTTRERNKIVAKSVLSAQYNPKTKAENESKMNI